MTNFWFKAVIKSIEIWIKILLEIRLLHFAMNYFGFILSMRYVFNAKINEYITNLELFL